MTDIDVPENAWRERCEIFSREHRGWLVNVRRVETARLEQDRAAALAAGQLLVSDKPLQQVVEAEQAGKVELAVTVGKGADSDTIRVADAVRLIRERRDGAHAGLRIDSNDGTSTLVEFRVAAVPETLDGVAESEL